MGWGDYGLDKQRVKEICMCCKLPDNYNLVKSAAIEVNLLLFDLLTINLTNGISYAKLKKDYMIPVGEKDFYGYRKRLIAILDKKIKR